MTIRARSTYDVYCNGEVGCRAILEDVDDTVAEPIAAGWTVSSATDLNLWTFPGAEIHLCPDCSRQVVPT